MKTATDRIKQKIKDSMEPILEWLAKINQNQDYLTAVHEAGHVVGYWAISHKIRTKRRRYWELQRRAGASSPPRNFRYLPDLPPKFQVVLRTPEEAEAGPYHCRSGHVFDCQGVVDIEEMDLHTRFELTAGEQVKFYAISFLTGPIAEIYAASFDKHRPLDWLFARENYQKEYAEAWEIVRHQYGGKRIGEGQMETLTTEAHDLVFNHWAAIEALAVKLVEKRAIESDEAIAIIEEASTKDKKENKRR